MYQKLYAGMLTPITSLVRLPVTLLGISDESRVSFASASVSGKHLRGW